MCCSKFLVLLSSCCCSLLKDAFNRSPGTNYSEPLVGSILSTALYKQEVQSVDLASTRHLGGGLYVPCSTFCWSHFADHNYSMLAATCSAVTCYVPFL